MARTKFKNVLVDDLSSSDKSANGNFKLEKKYCVKPEDSRVPKISEPEKKWAKVDTSSKASKSTSKLNSATKVGAESDISTGYQ